MCVGACVCVCVCVCVCCRSLRCRNGWCHVLATQKQRKLISQSHTCCLPCSLCLPCVLRFFASLFVFHGLKANKHWLHMENLVRANKSLMFLEFPCVRRASHTKTFTLSRRSHSRKQKLDFLCVWLRSNVFGQRSIGCSARRRLKLPIPHWCSDQIMFRNHFEYICWATSSYVTLWLVRTPYLARCAIITVIPDDYDRHRIVNPNDPWLLLSSWSCWSWHWLPS